VARGSSPVSSLRDVLYPQSIAIIGASKDPTKRGFRALRQLQDDRYSGPIYPVNPKETEIRGLKCYARIPDIPGPIGLALVCTPAHTVPAVIELCGEHGAQGAVVLAGGFAEAGDSGRTLQQQMVAAARAKGVRIIGPNTSGMFNTHQACNLAGFAHLKRGGVGLLSQSGNMALSLVTEAQASGNIGFSTYVGIGNEADIQFHEYLDYFAEDDNTKVVIVYIEGLQQGRTFLDTLRRVSRRKPVVIFKSGRTSAGRTSAKSHTGALAGDYAVSEGVLRQAGAILVRQSDQILAVAETLSLQRPLASRRVAVLADGGGHATIAADTLTEQGLVLASLQERTQQQLAAVLPPAAALANPVDVAGGTDADPSVFGECARILLEDDAVDGLLIAGLYGGYGVRFAQSLTESELATSDRIARLSRELGKPVIVYSLYSNLYADLLPAPLSRLRNAGIPVYGSLELTVRCLLALAEFGEAGVGTDSARAAASSQRQAEFARVLAACGTEARTVVLEHEARSALAAAGVRLAPAVLTHTAAEAVAAFNDLGRVPVALKIVSRDIIHKSEVDGVALNLLDTEGVTAAFTDIAAKAARAIPDANITGILVTPMAAKAGVEVIIGVVRDPSYGPVMMFGLGGVLVEVLKDVVFRALPLSQADARAMLDEIKAKAILAGVRGAPPVDKDALVKLMLVISDLCTSFPEIAELDLNPVRAYAQGLAILDARILLDAACISASMSECVQ